MEYDGGGGLDGVCGCGGGEVGDELFGAAIYRAGNDFGGLDVGGEFVLDSAWVERGEKRKCFRVV